MFETVIADATVVTPDGPGQWDIGIENGKIAAVAAAGKLDGLGRGGEVSPGNAGRSWAGLILTFTAIGQCTTRILASRSTRQDQTS